MSSSSDSPVTGPIETIVKGPRQRSWVALGAAVVGTVLAIVGFYTGILAALDGSGSGAGIALVLFFVGIALNLGAIVLAALSFAKRGRRIVPVIAIAIAVMPLLVIAMLAISARL